MSRLASERFLMFSPTLAKEVGLNEAIALQQIVFWVTETESGVVDDNGERWVYNTYPKWQTQFPFWSVETVKRVMTSLRDQSLIKIQQLQKSSHDRTNYYTVNWAHPSLSWSPHFASSNGSNPPLLNGSNPPLLHPEEYTEASPIHFDEILKAYQDICSGVFKGAEVLTPKRKANVKKLMQMKVRGKHPFRDMGVEFWEGYFTDCLENPHWRGESGGTWKADFEFITRVENAAKVLGV